jgi:NADH-quinone oxidoreductase subunit F
MQILSTPYPQPMLTGGLEAGKASFSALRSVIGQDRAAIIKTIADSGLRGRSGISRPAAEKWALCAAQPAADKLVVMNTIDGDPSLPAADTLLQTNPAGVIEGLLIAAYAVGATEAIICVDARNPELKASLQALIGESIASGALAGLACKIALADVPAKFVTREDTALLAALAGQPVMSGLTPPMPAQKGLQGRPTLVHHAETFAQVAAMFRQAATGLAWQQTKLVSLAGTVQNAGLCELPLGIALRTVFDEIGGGMPEGKTLKFVQVGGPNGFILTGEELDIALDYGAFEETGRWLGNASIMVRDTDTCIVDYVKTCAAFMEKAACGKCVMGREGTWQVREFIHDMTVGKSKQDDLDMLQELCNGIHEGALCPVCQTAGAAYQSAVERFAGEFEQHMKRRRCPALICNKYVTFHILPEKCTGCGECLPKCPVGAIAGENGLIHVIDQDTCNYCGICETVCRPIADAVARAGLVKPQTPEEPIPVGTFKRKAGGLGGGLRRR